jgi:glycerol kinase
VIYDNCSRGHREVIDILKVPAIVADLNDTATLTKALKDHKIDTVMHFAAYAYVGESVQQPLMYYRNNVATTVNVLECMQADSGQKAESLRVDGGATASDFLMQFQSDILGIPIQKPVITEMAALGAAYLAGLGVGFWKSKEEIAKQWKVAKVFEPRMSEDQKEMLYTGWKRAVERSLKWALE